MTGCSNPAGGDDDAQNHEDLLCRVIKAQRVHVDGAETHGARGPNLDRRQPRALRNRDTFIVPWFLRSVRSVLRPTRYLGAANALGVATGSLASRAN